ncbi:hypothetical protein Y717_00265 [Streptomyces scopuliridis RB72]|uniref:Uncharacterized protein n=1 Tax=Streptomyces scopuliridis RB72 TaxID=1440053 RepID=A0A2T7T9K7_9ACTN|nr:hypothetical protein Y717_00265 [Streptomyces scopuliridis RB72]
MKNPADTQDLGAEFDRRARAAAAQTKSFSLEWPGSPTLPASDGSGSPVKVGPIGSAGQGGQS